jgi:hypothetical protein
MLWYSVLIQCAFVGTKAELSISCMKTRILAGLLVAAALAIAPGVALARGGGGGGSHGGGGLHGGGDFHGSGFHGGFAHHGFVSDRSFRFGRGFRHDHDRFFGHHFVFGNPWPGYYDPYYLGAESASETRMWRAQLERQQQAAREAGRIGWIGNAGPPSR